MTGGAAGAPSDGARRVALAALRAMYLLPPDEYKAWHESIVPVASLQTLALETLGWTDVVPTSAELAESLKGRLRGCSACCQQPVGSYHAKTCARFYHCAFDVAVIEADCETPC